MVQIIWISYIIDNLSNQTVDDIFKIFDNFLWFLYSKLHDIIWIHPIPMP